MPTARSDRRLLTGAVLAALLTTSVAGCSRDEPPAPEPGQRADPSATPTVASGAPVRAPDVVRGITRALERRADAVRAGEREAFLAGVAAPEQAAQATYFDNLAALPVGFLDYRMDRRTLVRDGRGYWAEVEVALQLEGYDAVPVVTLDRYRFAPGPAGRFRVVSTTDPAWEEEHGTLTQPWDAGPVSVVAGSHALGIFDAGSAAAAERVVRDVEAGIAAVAAQVPYPWERRVVVYALSEPDFLAGLRDLPGDDPLALDAVTLPVPARAGSPELAGNRVVLNPRMVATPGPARDRLIRHELTHVALGSRQEVAPTWFSEGLAEYVSVQPVAPEDRAISGAALDAAEERFATMPPDEDFHGPGSQANYGIAWWACEYLAATYDESVLWVLLDTMTSPEDAGPVLRQVTGLGEGRLARKAAKLMLRTYRPADADDQPEEEPSESPGDDPSGSTSGDPSDGPSEEESSPAG